MLQFLIIILTLDAIAFFAAASKNLGVVDTSCFLLDILKPHLDYNILFVSEYSLLESIKSPVERHLFDKALSAQPDSYMIPSTNQPTSQQQFVDSNVLQEGEQSIMSSTKEWASRIGVSVSHEQAERLNLMRSYIVEQTAKAMSARAWSSDLGVTDESRSRPDVIVLSQQVPLKTFVIPNDNSASIPILPTNLISVTSTPPKEALTSATVSTTPPSTTSSRNSASKVCDIN